MKKPIAKIKLAPGNVAWYDPLTNIYLTLKLPEALVYEGDDLTNIKKAIRYNYISLREGVFPSLPKKKEIPKKEGKEKAKQNNKDKITLEITPFKETTGEVKTKGRGKNKKEHIEKETFKKEEDK